MPQKGGKEQKEKKVRPAAGQSAGGKELREVALLLDLPNYFILHAAHTHSPTTPKPWRGSPRDQGAKKPNYFSAGHWRTLNYIAQPKSWAELPKQIDALS